jgi:hypothetical protein
MRFSGSTKTSPRASRSPLLFATTPERPTSPSEEPHGRNAQRDAVTAMKTSPASLYANDARARIDGLRTVIPLVRRSTSAPTSGRVSVHFTDLVVDHPALTTRQVMRRVPQLHYRTPQNVCGNRVSWNANVRWTAVNAGRKYQRHSGTFFMTYAHVMAMKSTPRITRDVDVFRSFQIVPHQAGAHSPVGHAIETGIPHSAVLRAVECAGRL